MRKAFGLVQALIVIVLISGIMAIAMKYAMISVKQTGDLYARESAELFMDSAVELTLLAISGKDRTTGWLRDMNITSQDQRYSADINIVGYYLLNTSVEYNAINPLHIPIQNEESHGMVMLEVVVETNASHPKNQEKHIRLTRKTLQRP
ncbi:MAG: hypothetical protein PHE60_06740 [Sulfurospirillaceae bacterium]|nr:hypothetical protein [Sulfurospirillaceae bacterium]